MGIYREDLVDIELESGTIHRSLMNIVNDEGAKYERHGFVII